MASPIDLISLSQLETYLNANNAAFNSGFTTQNGPLAITACSRDWLKVTGRRSLNRFVPCMDSFDGAGGDRQYLRDFPAALVSAVSVFGSAVPPGSMNAGGVTPGWVLDQSRESISIIGLGPQLFGLRSGPGGAYAATGGPLTRQYGGWGLGVKDDSNRQNVQISYFGGGSVMFAETVQIMGGSISLSQAASFYMDLGVIYSSPVNGQLVALTPVPSSPAAGQYTVSSIGAYGFNTADNNSYVSVTYAINQPPEDVTGWVLVQVAEMLEKRKQLGLKQQGSQESGTTTYTWDVPKSPAISAVQFRYKRAMVGG